jgi:tape measure domain-containing protein
MMSGILIDVDTRSDSAKQDLAELNKNLATLIRQAGHSQVALDKVQATGFKNVNKELSSGLKAFNNFNTTGKRSLDATTKSSDNLAGSLSTVRDLVLSVGAALAGLAGVSYFNKMADDLTNVQNRLKLVTNGTDDLIRSQQRLYRLSVDTRASFAGTANAFVDFTKSLEGTGESQAKVLSVIRTIQQASALSGSSVESINAAMVQLNQGVSSGTLRGEELNSVMEQMKYLGVGLQKTMGMNAGQLRKFAEEGQLTTQVLLDAIGRMSAQTDEDFKKTSTTVEQSIGRLKAAAAYLVGDFSKFYGFSDRFAARVIKLSNGIDRFGASVGASVFTFREGVRNYINQFSLFDAASLTVRAALKLEISPLDALDKYQQYKNIKAAIDTFQDYIGLAKKTEVKVKVGVNADVSKPNTDVEGVDEIDVSKVRTLKQTLADIGNLFYEVGRGVGVTFTNIFKLLPTIVGPVQTVASSFRQFFRNLKADADAATYDAIMPFVRSLEAIDEFIHAYRDTDTELERTWVNLFKSDSLVEFTDNLRDLNEVRQSLRFDDTNLLKREAFRGFNKLRRPIEDVLISLNLMDNRLIQIRSANFDRVIRYFQDIYLVTKRIYEDVFATTVNPIAARVKNLFMAIGETVYDAITDIFTEDVGARLGAFVSDTISGAIKGAFSVVRRLRADKSWYDIFSTEGISQKMLDGLKKGFAAVMEFVSGFFSGLTSGFGVNFGPSVFTKAFRSIRSALSSEFSLMNTMSARAYAKLVEPFSKIQFRYMFDFDRTVFDEALNYIAVMFDKVGLQAAEKLAKAEVAVKKFGQRVKDIFFDAYDAVVGHSYWPDLVDGVVNYTNNLFGATSTIDKFTSFVKNSFSKLTDTVAGSRFGDMVGEFMDKIRGINTDQVFKSLSNSIGASVLAGLAFAFGSTRMKITAAGYFLSVMNLALDGAISAFSPLLGEAAGGTAAVIAEHVAKGLIKAVDTFIAAAPQFLAGFASAFAPVVGTISNAIGQIPILGDLIGNNLYPALLLAAGAFALFTKKGSKVISELVFGKEGKKGKDGKKSKKTEGIIDYVKAIIGAPSQSIVDLLFSSKKLALTAAAVMSTALLDSVSLIDAAALGLPILGFAMFGKDGGARFARDSSMFVWKLLSDALKKGEDFVLSRASKDGLISKLLTPSTKPVTPAVKSGLSEAFSELGLQVRQLFVNMRANTSKYAEGALSFKEMFTVDSSFVGPIKPGTQSRLKEAFTNLLSQVSLTKVGSRTIGEYFNAVSGAFTTGLAKVKASYQSSNILGTIQFYASNVFAAIKNSAKNAFTLIADGVTLLAGILKNKFILFGVLSVGLSSFAFAASDAATAVSSLGAVLTSLALPVALLASLGMASRAVGAYRKGYADFAEGLVSDQAKAARNFELFAAGEAFEKSLKEEQKARKAAFEKSLKVELNDFKKAKAESIAERLRNDSTLSSAVLRKTADIEALQFETSRRTSFDKDSKGIDERSRAQFKRQADLLRAADIQAALAGKENLARKAGLQAAMAAITEKLMIAKGAALSFGAGVAAIVSSPALLVTKLVALIGAIQTYTSVTILSTNRMAAFTLAATAMSAAIQKIKAGEAAAGIGLLVSSMKTITIASFGVTFASLVGSIKLVGRSLFNAASLVGFAKSAFKGLFSILKAGFKFLWPFLKKPTLITAAVTAVGVLGVWLFGPGNTFIDNLEWAYDKVKSFFGLQPTTRAGRAIAIGDNLSPDTIGNYSSDFTAQLANVDFGKLSAPQTKLLLETSRTFKEGMDNLHIEFERQGFLTEAQISQQKSLEEELKQILLRQPATEEASFQTQVGKFSEQILEVDNGLWAMFKRFVGYTPILTKIENETSTLQKAFVYAKKSFTSWPAIILGTVGAFFGPVTALIGASIGALISATIDGLGYLLGAGASWVDDLLGISSFFKKLGDSLSSFWKLVGGFKGIGQAIIAPFAAFVKDFKNAFSVKPSDEQVARNARLKAVSSDVEQYGNYLPAEVNKVLMDSLKEYKQAEKQYAKLQARGFTGIQEKSFKEFEIKRDAAKVKLDEMEARYSLLAKTYGDFAKENFMIKKFNDEMQKLSSEAKTLLDLDIGKFAENFVGKPKDLEKLRNLIEDARTNKFVKSRVYTKEAQNNAQLNEENLKRRAKEELDRITAQSRFETNLEYNVKVAGIDVAVEDLRRLAFGYSESYVAFQESSKKIFGIQQKISDALNNDQGPELVKKLYKELGAAKVEAIEAAITGFDFNLINKRLQAAGIDQIAIADFIGLREADVTAIGGRIDIIRKHQQELVNASNEGAPFKDYVGILKKIQEEVNKTKDAVRLIEPPQVVAAKTLGVSNADVYALGGKAQARALGLSDRLYQDRKDLDDPNFQGDKRAIARRIQAAERTATKMFEKGAEDIFARFSEAMQRRGVSLDLGEFVKFDFKTQGIAKDLIERMGAIKAKLNSAGSIYPSNAKWFQEQYLKFEQLQKQLDEYKAKADTSFSAVIDRISESGFDLDLNSAFYISDSTIQRLAEVADQIRLIMKDLKDPSFKGNIRDKLNELAGKRKEQRAERQAIAGGGDRTSLIKSQFADLGLEDRDITALPTSLQAQLYNEAVRLSNLTEDTAKLIGEAYTKSARALEADRKETTASLAATVAPFKVSTFGTQSSTINSVGTETRLSDDEFAKLSTGTRDSLFKLADKIRIGSKELTDKTGDAATDAARELQRLKKEFEKLMQGSAEGVRKPTENLVNRANLAGLNVDRNSANLLSDQQVNVFDKMARKIAERQKAANEATNEEDRRRAQFEAFNLQDAFETTFKRLATKPSEMPAALQAKAFASSLVAGVETSIIDVLKGKMSLKDGIKSVLDTFTSGIIDSFVKGLTDPFTGENGLTQRMRNLGGNIFNLGRQTAGMIPGSESMPSAAAAPSGEEGNTGILESISSTLSGGFAGLTGFFAPMLTTFTSMLGFNTAGVSVEQAQLIYLGTLGITIPAAIEAATVAITTAITTSTDAITGIVSASDTASDGIGLFAGLFAEGGRIVGPGTGTSDSITAMVSNGEYIINAKATKANLPLLEAINSGKLPKFAEGGLVGQSMIAVPAYVPVEQPVSNSQSVQTFNIQITGDISRQTKSEIYKMLPSIAAGVNQHNREKGR